MPEVTPRQIPHMEIIRVLSFISSFKSCHCFLIIKSENKVCRMSAKLQKNDIKSNGREN